MDELLPALDTRLGPGRDLATALRAALANQIAPVRLDAPPFEPTMHALEIHVDEIGQSVVLLAEPAGVSRGGFFPLRLSVPDDEQRAIVDRLLAECESIPPPPPASDAFVGRTIGGGKYRIEHMLGAGAVGRVYRAIHLGLARPVAVKLLHPFFANSADFIARFHDEALTASRLDHANVTRVLDFGQEPDGTLYLVMEYLEGTHLEAILERDGPLAPERAVDLMKQVCAALSAAHDSGIVHRDIKPENIVVISGKSDDGTTIEVVKVCDFGIAQLQEEGRPGAVGQICGSPAYMSPEQGRGEFLDPRSDIYACGITLFQLLTGRVPFEAEDLRALLVQHATEIPRRPSELRSEIGLRLDRVVLKCLSKEREDRYLSARELRAALSNLNEPAVSQPAMELEEFVSLSDSRSGFYRFVGALSALLLLRDKTAPRSFIEAASHLLRYCGELTLARGPNDGPLVVISGAGEMSPMVVLLDAEGESAREMAARLDRVFRDSGVYAATFRTGIDEMGLAALSPLMRGNPVRGGRLTAAVSVLTEEDRLGRNKRLPWIVELVVSRIAHDLDVVWSASIEVAAKREWRSRILREVLRTLDSVGALLAVLEQGDLVERVADEAMEDRTFAYRAFEVLPFSRSQALADLLMSDVPMSISKRVVVALGTRLAREQSTEAESILRDLRAKKVLAWTDLPAEVQDWLRGSEGAALLARGPQTILSGLGLLDETAFCRELGWIRHALPLVIRRGDAAAGRAVHAELMRHRRSASSPEQQARIAETLAIFDRPEVLRALVETLLFGDPAQREPARLLLIGTDGAVDNVLRAVTSYRPSAAARNSRHPGMASVRPGPRRR